MFDVGASELLVIVIVAVLVIGPKDMPAALRAAGRWIGKMRRMSAHFRSGLDAMIREAEMEEMEKKWANRNAEIMAKYPQGDEEAGGAPPVPQPDSGDGVATPDNLLPPAMDGDATDVPAASAEAMIACAPTRGNPARKPPAPPVIDDAEPTLPLDPPPAKPSKDG